MNTVLMDPPSFEMAATETLPLTLETAPLLAHGETPSSPSAVMTNRLTGADVTSSTISGAVVISGTRLVVTVHGLSVGVDYRLATTFTASAGKVWTMQLDIHCGA